MLQPQPDWIDPLVFSDIMTGIDLFVGVASVGNARPGRTADREDATATTGTANPSASLA